MLTDDDGDTAIAGRRASIVHVLRTIREETSDVYHEHALRCCVMESSESDGYWYTIFQGHGNEVA